MATITDVRNFMNAAVGKLTPAKAQELAKSLMSGQGKEQVSKAATELLEWSNRNRQRISDLVRGEVSSQLSSVGVASKDELDALKKRVRDLERAQGPKKRSTAKRSTAKRATTKPKTKSDEAGAASEPPVTRIPVGDA
jgi:polyhydroxyalkanoate synthesis regulator phasin